MVTQLLPMKRQKDHRFKVSLGYRLSAAAIWKT